MSDKTEDTESKITCRNCGIENVPDWKDGLCITCARDKVLDGSSDSSSSSDNTQELDEIFTKYTKQVIDMCHGNRPDVADESAKAKQALLDWHNKQMRITYQKGYQDGLLKENKIATKYKTGSRFDRYEVVERLTKGGKHKTHNVRLLVKCLDCDELNIRYANRLSTKHMGCTYANNKLKESSNG